MIMKTDCGEKAKAGQGISQSRKQVSIIYTYTITRIDVSLDFGFWNSEMRTILTVLVLMDIALFIHP